MGQKSKAARAKKRRAHKSYVPWWVKRSKRQNVVPNTAPANARIK